MTGHGNDIPPAVRSTAHNPMTFTEENPMNTDLTRWPPGDDMTHIVLDEAHGLLAGESSAKLIAGLCRHGRKAGVNIDLGDDVWQVLRRQAALVEMPAGPTTPPTLPDPTPTTGQKVDTAGALIVLTGAIAGLATHNSPDLVGYPIAATLVAAAIGARVLYGSPARSPR